MYLAHVCYKASTKEIIILIVIFLSEKELLV